MPHAHLAPRPLLWQLPRGPVPRLWAIWGEHPAGHPEETPSQRCRARPSQARTAAAMGLWGLEASLCSVSARHQTASANCRKQMYNRTACSHFLPPSSLFSQDILNRWLVHGFCLQSCPQILLPVALFSHAQATLERQSDANHSGV